MDRIKNVFSLRKEQTMLPEFTPTIIFSLVQINLCNMYSVCHKKYYVRTLVLSFLFCFVCLIVKYY